MATILSKLSSAQEYTFYADNMGGKINRPIKTIRINGGANIADKNFITPQGVTTFISDEDLEILVKHPIFQLHVNNGFVKVVQSSNDKGEDLEQADQSAPLTPKTYKKMGKRAPKSKE